MSTHTEKPTQTSAPGCHRPTRAKLFLLCCPHSCSPSNAPAEHPQRHPAPYPGLVWRVWREAQQGRVPETAALPPAPSSQQHLPSSAKKSPHAGAGWADPHPKMTIQGTDEVTPSLRQPKCTRCSGWVALFPANLQACFLNLLQENFAASSTAEQENYPKRINKNSSFKMCVFLTCPLAPAGSSSPAPGLFQVVLCQDLMDLPKPLLLSSHCFPPKYCNRELHLLKLPTAAFCPLQLLHQLQTSPAALLIFTLLKY